MVVSAMRIIRIFMVKIKIKRLIRVLKLLMETVAHAQIAKYVTINGSCRIFERYCGWLNSFGYIQ